MAAAVSTPVGGAVGGVTNEGIVAGANVAVISAGVVVGTGSTDKTNAADSVLVYRDGDDWTFRTIATLIGLGLLIVSQMILAIFAAAWLYAGSGFNPYYWWMTYWIGIGILLLVVSGVYFWWPLVDAQYAPIPQRASWNTFIATNWFVYLIFVVWSALWFSDYGHTENDAPVPGDPEFPRFQRLMSFQVFLAPFLIAIQLIAFGYAWARPVGPPPSEIEAVAGRQLAYSFMSSRTKGTRYFYATVSVFLVLIGGAYCLTQFFHVLGLNVSLNFQEYSYFFVAVATMIVLHLVASIVLYTDRTNKVADLASDKLIINGGTDAEMIYTVGTVGKYVHSVYDYHYRAIWHFNIMLIAWLAFNSIAYVAMVSGSVINGSASLNFGAPGVQSDTYYIFNGAFGVVNAAFLTFFVYMTYTLYGIWELISADGANVVKQTDTIVRNGSATRINFYGTMFNFDRVWAGLDAAFELIVGALVLAELCGWYHLNKHYFAWFVTVVVVRGLFWLVMALRNFGFVAAFLVGRNVLRRDYNADDNVSIDIDSNDRLGPYAYTTRLRTTGVAFVLWGMSLAAYWIFYEDFVESHGPMQGGTNSIPKDQIKGAAAQTLEAPVIWFTMWSLNLAIAIISLMNIFDYAYNIASNELMTDAVALVIKNPSEVDYSSDESPSMSFEEYPALAATASQAVIRRPVARDEDGITNFF